MVTYNKYKAVPLHNDYGAVEWWVMGYGSDGTELKLFKIAHWVRHQKATAEMAAASMTKNKKLMLADLI